MSSRRLEVGMGSVTGIPYVSREIVARSRAEPAAIPSAGLAWRGELEQ